ncbi:family 20 glycosylhydrolase [candidate division KSB1 bacterium]|nr:family 20 glycosylhydrolase [candidate division KSB1 bacterium]
MNTRQSQPFPVLPKPKLCWRTDFFLTFESISRILSTGPFSKLAKNLIGGIFPSDLPIQPFNREEKDPHAVYLLYPEQMGKMLEKYKLKFTPYMEKEGYVIIVESDALFIGAKTSRGLFYAIKTLDWLTKSELVTSGIPGCVICDWPDFELRGISDDISRGQVSTMENFKQIIDFLADFKMNVYMPYLEDMYRFDCYPSIGRDRGALTKEECVELQDYADKRHVEIIPIFQTLGHYENLLLQPEFVHLADFPGAGSLNVTDEGVYTFLQNVLDEICPVFRSVYFHIGADESWDVGMGASRAAARRHGVATVHARHYQRIFDVVKKHGKKVMMYGDIILDHPAILNQIPRDTIIVDWHYDVRPYYESTEIFNKSGYKYIVSPGIQSWSRIFPNIGAAVANIDHFIQSGLKNGAVGVIASNWGDFGGANFRELSYYPFAVAADKSWNYNGHQTDEFEKLFFKYYYGVYDPGLSHVFHILAKAAQGFKTDHLFGFPFYVPEYLEALAQRSCELPLFCNGVMQELKKLRSVVRQNQEHLDIFELCAEMILWFGRLSAVQQELYQYEKYDPDDESSVTRALANLSADLMEIKSKYRTIWLRTNRPENLHRILALMDRLKLCLDLKKDNISADHLQMFSADPPAFITHPLALSHPVSEIYTRRKFVLEEKPVKAWLQIIAESHVKIWLNDRQLGEKFARRSLSAIVEAERVAVWDVTDLLQQGNNCFAVHVKNYDPTGKAAVNVWLELPHNKPLLCSDPYWKVCDLYIPGWTSKHFDDSNWLSAVELKSKWIFNRPWLEHNLPSRIEFYKERFL